MNFLVYFTITVALGVTAVWGRDCLARDQCACQFDDDSALVSITSFGNTDGTPRFKDVSSPDGSDYSYNPCYPFTEGNCQDVAVCSISGTLEQSIGDASRTEWRYDADTDAVIATYISSSGLGASTDVNFMCDPTACEPIISADGATGLNLYKLTVTTVCACPNGCTDTGPVNCKSKSSGGIGGGSVFLIVVFSLLFIYVIGGIVYMKAVRKARGAEVIPNVEFWRSFPLLVKDGFAFTFSPCMRRSGYTQK